MNDPTYHRAPAYVPEKLMGSNVPFKPISDEICAACGAPIDVQPGETFTASTDGKVWHYGCSPSRTRPPLLPCEGALKRVGDRLKKAGEHGFTTLRVSDVRAIYALATRPTVLPCDDELVERVAETIADFLDERFPQGAMPGGQQLFATDHLDAEFNHEAGCEELARTILAAIEAGGAVAATSGETPNPGPVTGEGQGDVS